MKRDLLTWFVKLQLSEYLVLFAEDQDVSIFKVMLMKFNLSIILIQ